MDAVKTDKPPHLSAHLQRTWPKGLLTVVVFVASFAALLGLSFLYLGSHSWRFVDATYGFL